MPELSIALIQEASRGNRQAVRELVDLLLPVVHYRVARALLRRRGRSRPSRDVRKQTEALLEGVFRSLFADNARALRRFRPGRGVSLLSYIGLLAEREARALLWTPHRNPWTEVPVLTDAQCLQRDGSQATDSRIGGGGAPSMLLDRMWTLLSERDLELFQLVVIEARPAEEICTLMDMTPEAVYAARSRLARLTRGVAAQLIVEAASVADTSITGRG